MTQLVVFFAAQQHAREHVGNRLAVRFAQPNHHFREEVRVKIEIDVLLPVFRGIEQLCAAALFELEVEKNNIRRIEVVACQFKKNVVGLFQRFVFGKAFKSMIDPVCLEARCNFRSFYSKGLKK